MAFILLIRFKTKKTQILDVSASFIPPGNASKYFYVVEHLAITLINVLSLICGL